MFAPVIDQPTLRSSGSSVSTSHRTQYRPDIDGLRALAVLGVVFYHAGLGFPGGYVGVDVFFVISGFLITSLLLKDLRNGTFSLLDFWERRARRILPALFVVVLAIIGAGWFMLLPDAYDALGRHVAALVGLSSNIRFWYESGYFATSGAEKPMLHTWSLSVEEQFYLLIPLLLAVLFKWRKSTWVVPVLVCGAIVSFGVAVHGAYTSPDSTFYLLPTRAWELAAGSLLACATPIASHRLRHVAAWLGLAAILVPYFLYFPGIHFPGLAALPPVAGAALLIWSGLRVAETDPMPLPGLLLATRPMVWIGLLSYSLYLWHWPLFAFQKYQHYETSSEYEWLGQVCLVLLSIVLAALSLHFVERPFRSRKFIQSRSTIFGLSAVAAAVMLSLSLMLWWSQGARQRLSPEIARIAAGRSDVAFRKGLRLRDVPDRLVHFGAAGGKPKVFVWGDSHAMAILPAVDAVCRENGISGLAATAHATIPVLDWHPPRGLKRDAPAYNAAVFDFIEKARNEGVSHVILAGRWEYDREDPDRQDASLKALSKSVAKLANTGCRVILVKQCVIWEFDPPRTLALAMLRGSSIDDFATSVSIQRKRTAHSRRIFQEIENLGLGVQFIDPVDYFADDAGVIRPADAGGVLFWDKTHLTTHGSMRLKPAFQQALFPASDAAR